MQTAVEPESGLWVVGAGTQARLVLPGDAPWSWSPIGAQLAYADVDELILLDPTTWERTTISTAGGTISGISWGPDGRSIAYAVERPSSVSGDDASSGVFVLRSGGEPHRVSRARATGGIDWSPDGGSLVLDGIEGDRSVIEVVRADGSDARVLASGPMSEPVWSPDGRRIAFIRTPREGATVGLEYWVIDAGRAKRSAAQRWGRRAISRGRGQPGVVARFEAHRMVGGRRVPLAGDRCRRWRAFATGQKTGGRRLAAGLSPVAGPPPSAGEDTRRIR